MIWIQQRLFFQFIIIIISIFFRYFTLELPSFFNLFSFKNIVFFFNYLKLKLK